MEHLIIALAASAILMTSAMAQKIGSHFVRLRAPVSRQSSMGHDGTGQGTGGADPIRRGPGGYRKAA